MDTDPDIQKFGEEEDALVEKGDLEGATELNLRMWVDGPFRAPDQVSRAESGSSVRVMQMDAFRVPVPGWSEAGAPGSSRRRPAGGDRGSDDWSSSARWTYR